MDLIQKHCVPCEGGVAPLTSEQIKPLLEEVSSDWVVLDDKKIRRLFAFKDFKHAMVFVDSIAEVAEEQGHHPDITIQYNRVTIELWTHAIGGLSENDFIMAAKIDALR